MMHVEEEITSKQALQMDIEASVEMPTGKIQDLPPPPPPPPTTQEEVRWSPFPKALEHSQKVELNRLLDVGCFKVVDDKYVPKVGNWSRLDGCTRSRVVKMATAWWLLKDSPKFHI